MDTAFIQKTAVSFFGLPKSEVHEINPLSNREIAMGSTVISVTFTVALLSGLTAYIVALLYLSCCFGDK